MQNNTMTVREIATQAGAPNADMFAAGRYPVYVETSTGKSRKVTGAQFTTGLVLVTREAFGTMTVEQVVRAAGGDSSASLRQYGEVPVTVLTRGGKTRPVTGVRFSRGALTLTTGK